MEHIWKVNDLSRTTNEGVVNKVEFGLYSSVGTDPKFETRKLGEIEITGSVSDPGFVAYNDLTEAIVLGWVNNNIDEAAWEVETSSSLAEMESNYSAPTHEAGLPW